MQEFKATDKYPIPTARGPRKRPDMKASPRQKAISDLKVGWSFWIDTSISSVGTLRWWAEAKFPERDFVSRAEGKGVRVWRVK